MAKKIIAFILSASLLLSAFAIPSYAATEVTSAVERKFYQAVDDILDVLINGIAALIVEPREWKTKDEYVSKNFYEGLTPEEFIDTPAENAQWSLGYSNASILTGDELTGENGDYYVGGSLSVSKKLATDQKDDQKVRTVAVSDGRGISIFAVIDAFGLANNEVRAIREMFAEYASGKGLNITSVNVSVLHQHSCVDTFGMNGDIWSALFTSSFKNLFGRELPSGKNESYMENLRKVTVDSMIKAVESMEPGTLYYGTADIAQYIRDKREPKVSDGNLNRIRFVPAAEGSKETWIVNLPIHCVGNGAAGTVLTGDYPYYMEKYINENANANFLMLLGAELALSSQYPSDFDEKYTERYEKLAAFGTLLGQITCSVVDSEEIAPILNITYDEIFVPVDNSIFRLAARGGLLTNTVVKNGRKYEAVSEIGYAEFGKNLAVALIPGELAPEIAYGSAVSAQDSWLGTSWDYAPLSSTTDKHFLVFGLTNDQIGYMLTENDWRSYLTENEEIVSTGPKAGTYITQAYFALTNELK